MGKIISLICFLLPVVASAADAQVSANAPDRHVVVKGDTLWGIAAEFFNNPWKWPEIWGINKDSIDDPHWIYPGDVILLDRASGTLHVDRPRAEPGRVVKLSPGIRVLPGERQAITTLPMEAVTPFLSQSRIISQAELDNTPMLVGSPDRRLLLGGGDAAYAKGLKDSPATSWQICRLGKPIVVPESGEVLGHEAIALGAAELERQGDPALVRIIRSREEVQIGDRLIPPADDTAPNLQPHAPAADFSARVLSIHGEVAQGGQYAILTLDKGRQDGLEPGHVLALQRKGDLQRNEKRLNCAEADQTCRSSLRLALPDRSYGLALVFRTFDRLAYALVMQTTLPIERLDSVRAP